MKTIIIGLLVVFPTSSLFCQSNIESELENKIIDAFKHTPKKVLKKLNATVIGNENDLNIGERITIYSLNEFTDSLEKTENFLLPVQFGNKILFARGSENKGNLKIRGFINKKQTDDLNYVLNKYSAISLPAILSVEILYGYFLFDQNHLQKFNQIIFYCVENSRNLSERHLFYDFETMREEVKYLNSTNQKSLYYVKE